MLAIKKGFNIRTFLTVKRNKMAEDFTSATNVTVSLRNKETGSLLSIPESQISIVNNVVSSLITDVDQSKISLGYYDLCLSYRKPNVDSPTGYEPYGLDVPVFQLVAFSYQAGGVNDCELLGVTVVNISGDVGINRDGLPGKTAYEIALKDGFVGTEEDWLFSLKKPAEDAATKAANDVQKTLDDFDTLKSDIERQETTRNENEIQRGTTFDSKISEVNTAISSANAVSRNQALYNVTLSVPPAAGTFYALSGAIAAVPVISRAIGLDLKFATATGTWVVYRYKGADLTGWTTVSNWELVPDAAKVASIETDLNELELKLFSHTDGELFDFDNIQVKAVAPTITTSYVDGQFVITNSDPSLNASALLVIPDTEVSKTYELNVNATNIKSVILYKGVSTDYVLLTLVDGVYKVEFTGNENYWIGISIGSNRSGYISEISLMEKDFVSVEIIKNTLIKGLDNDAFTEEFNSSFNSSIHSFSNSQRILLSSRNRGVPSGLSIVYNLNGSVTFANTTVSNLTVSFLVHAEFGVSYAIAFNSDNDKDIIFSISQSDFTTSLLNGRFKKIGECVTDSFVNGSQFYNYVVVSLTFRGNSTYTLSNHRIYRTDIDEEVPNSGITQLSKSALKRRYDVPCNTIMYQKGGANVDIFTNGLIDSDTRDGEYYLKFSNDEYLAKSEDSIDSIRVNNCGTRVRLDSSQTIASNEIVVIYDDFGEADVINLNIKDTGTPVNPVEEKFVLMIGDSLTARRILPTEFRKYLNASGLTNYKMVGRVQIEAADGTLGVNYDAQGGYAWPNYVDDPSTLPASHPNNYFWDSSVNRISVKYYMNTYCNGVSPAAIICNVGWNQFLNGAYNTMSMEDMKTKVRIFLDTVHTEYPSCKVCLTGLQRGKPNANVYTHKIRNIYQIKLAKAYQEICGEEAYKNFVIYGNIAPYFDGRFGVAVSSRSTSMFNDEVEEYVVDEIHPNEIGYKMFAYGNYLHFLYMMNKM